LSVDHVKDPADIIMKKIVYRPLLEVIITKEHNICMLLHKFIGWSKNNSWVIVVVYQNVFPAE